MTDKEKILLPYKKECTKCNKLGLVPKMNGNNLCLDCLKDKLKLESWETICLQCGLRKSGMPSKHKICLNCLNNNRAKARYELEKNLTLEQVQLFEEFCIWEGMNDSFIILMS